MTSSTREEQLRTHAQQAARRLVRAGDNLASRQVATGPARGNVPPWAGQTALDFHGTLQAIWVWSRAVVLGGETHFAGNVASAWTFIGAAWSRFIPASLGSAASEESPYDCAMVLRAALASRPIPGGGGAEVRRFADGAARLLGAYLADLDDFGGRDFRDPGFLAWALLEWARATEDRGLIANGRKFVDRAFGMKTPGSFAEEPATPAADGLFDFSSTTATRVLSVIAAEGATPFVGAWLRERVGPTAPAGFLDRPLDENTWNGCVAAALGQAYVVSTDGVFRDAHAAITNELARRANDGGGALGRRDGFGPETRATFYYALALDALVKE